ncbi:MAG: YaeQ family protein [Geobacter sp.]|nr:YaeQ family protein [Geobacter sp.]
MALPSTVYKASIQLSDVDRGIYETLQATVAQHPSETAERLVARLLSYAIFHEPELAFTKGISATDEPDLWVKGADGRVRFWVEVGLPEADRIIKASRHSERVGLLACGRALANWEQQHLPKLEKLANLTVISIDQAFIIKLAAQLGRSINWSITITEGTFYLTNVEETMEAAIQVKMGEL